MTANLATFRSVSPMIPTGGTLAQALVFFTEHLGFTIAWQSGGGAGIQRGDVSFMLVENGNREWADNASFSIAVSDLNSLYAEYKNVPARIGPLEMKFWGRREFHMILPSGVCFQFFQFEK